MNQEKPNIDDLEAFLIDNTLSKTDAVKELRSQGVNTEALFSRVKRIVQDGYSAQLRLAAEHERSSRASTPGFLVQLATMSREAMLAVFERVASGEFGVQYSEVALARCRNKDASGLTDEELRSWLEDIGEVLGEPRP